jgi:hypothetical protein
MRRSSVPRFLVLFLLSAAGCSLEQGSEETSPPCSAALKPDHETQGTRMQGASLNGHNLNKLAANGESLNRIALNGTNLNRIAANGHNLNKLATNGHNLNKLAANGQNLNRIALNGESLNRISLNGRQINGFANGENLNRLAANGIDTSPAGLAGANFAESSVAAEPNAPIAFDPRLLEGTALRGLTLEDAMSWVEGRTLPVRREHLVRVGFADGGLLGRDLDGRDVVGAELTGLLLPFSADTGATVWLEVQEVAAHPQISDLPLYTLALDGENVCDENAAGLFVPGVWDETGARHETAHGADTTFACLSGVIGKCVTWGYRPWLVGSDLHQTCTRMARADYCGDGVPHTEDGTLIDVFDPAGIQVAVEDAALSFEAGWSTEGAVCVNVPRYVKHDVSGQTVYPSCWAQKPTCEDWESALELGARIGNDSQHLSRQLQCSL